MDASSVSGYPFRSCMVPVFADIQIMNKTKLFETLQTERAKWELVLEQVGKQAWTIPGVVGDWSVQDVIAHIMSYEHYILDRLLETLRGEAYSPSETPEALTAYLEKHGYPDFGSSLLDDDGPNAWVVQHHSSRPVDEVVRQERQIFDQLLQAIRGLSEDALAEHRYAERIESNTTEHYQHHARDIRNWLDSVTG
jgi:hypothetical protein